MSERTQTLTESERTNTAKFIAELDRLGIQLAVDGNQLQYDAAPGALTPGIIDELRSRKPQILQILTENNCALESNTKPILPVPRNNDLPLSFAQQRLWFMHQLVPDNTSYNVPTTLELIGVLDQSALQWSLDQIVARHESFRTTVESRDGKPVQVIASAISIDLPLIDLTDFPQEKRDKEAQRKAAEVVQLPFDISKGPLIRACLLRLDETKHILVLPIHHIIFDGWSMTVFVGELAEFYDACCSNRQPSLQPLPIQYADFANWQRDWLCGNVLERQLAYWKNQLVDAPRLELPTDYERPAVPSFRGARKQQRLSKTLSDQVQRFCQLERVTLFMTMMAAFKTLLHRYTRQEDLVVATAVANRNRAETEGLIGFFVNTLVIRTDASGDPTFRELVHRVQELAISAYCNQDLPFEKLVDELQPTRDLSEIPLTQVVFTVRNAIPPPPPMGDLQVSLKWADNHSARFDLEGFVWDEPEGLQFGFTYNSDLFESKTIERMLGHWQVLLEAAVSEPDQCLSQLPLLSERERHCVLVESNQTQSNYPRTSCIHQLFEEQVKKRPNATAVFFEHEEISYRELDEKTNQWARYLKRSRCGTRSQSWHLRSARRGDGRGAAGYSQSGWCLRSVGPRLPPTTSGLHGSRL